jgi:hypothetical protein
MAGGAVGAVGRVNFKAECAEVAEKMGVPHPGCFAQRVRKNMKRKELWFCAVQKSA